MIQSLQNLLLVAGTGFALVGLILAIRAFNMANSLADGLGRMVAKGQESSNYTVRVSEPKGFSPKVSITDVDVARLAKHIYWRIHVGGSWEDAGMSKGLYESLAYDLLQRSRDGSPLWT